MKRFFAYATLLLLSLCLTVPALAAGPAITEGAAVTDLGGVLTAEELASLEDTAQSLADEYGCGVYALLLPDFTVYGYEDIFDFAQDVFEETRWDWDDSKNGVLLAVSTETRDVSIAVHGDSGNTAFTDYGREEVLYDAFLSDFGNDDWYAGLEHYLDTCGYLLSETANGTPGGCGAGGACELRRGLRFLLRHGPDSGGDHCLHCLRHYEGTHEDRPPGR